MITTTYELFFSAISPVKNGKSTKIKFKPASARTVFHLFE